MLTTIIIIAVVIIAVIVAVVILKKRKKGGAIAPSPENLPAEKPMASFGQPMQPQREPETLDEESSPVSSGGLDSQS